MTHTHTCGRCGEVLRSGRKRHLSAAVVAHEARCSADDLVRKLEAHLAARAGDASEGPT